MATLTPRAEIEGDTGDAHMGVQARLMSQALRKLTAVISKTKTCVVFIKVPRQPRANLRPRRAHRETLPLARGEA